MGRSPTSDLRFDDPGVSRTHAVLRCQGEAVYLEDIDSTSGTFVNRDRVTTRRRLRPGDVIALAGVLLRFEDPRRLDSGPQTAVSPRPSPVDHRQVRFDVDEQRAKMINNAAGDIQINERKQYLIHQRDNFLREVAATRTKARYLILLGFVLMVVGFSMFAGGVLSFLSQISQIDESTVPSRIPTPVGRDLFGVPSGLLGWALSAAGSFILLIGIVMHVVATSRRRHIDQNYPDPRAWPETMR